MREEPECAFSPLQISSEEISVKKEQLSEALQGMQLFLAKHGDKYVGFKPFIHSSKVVFKMLSKVEDVKF